MHWKQKGASRLYGDKSLPKISLLTFFLVAKWPDGQTEAANRDHRLLPAIKQREGTIFKVGASAELLCVTGKQMVVAEITATGATENL